VLAGTAAIRAVIRNGDIARLEAAWLTANAATYAFLVTTLVVAYDTGGAIGAGLVGVMRYLPPALIAPLAGLPAARWRTDRVLLAVNLGRAAAMLLAFAILVSGGPVPVLFLLVAIEAGLGGLTRPLHMSLLPWLARTPGELVASNIASSAAEGLGTLIGPAIAGILLATSGPSGATAGAAALMALSVLGVASTHVSMIRTGPVGSELRSGLTAGLHAVRRTATVRLVLASFSLQTCVRGMLTVLLVVAAIETLGMGDPGVGTLNAAIGAGGFVGAVVALSLTGRTRFGSTFALSLAMWGLPIAVIGIVADPIVAAGLLAIVGMSNALLDVTGFTLLQRSTPNHARVGVMGIADSLGAVSAAIGGLLASALIGRLGVAGAFVVAGAILPVAALIILPSMRRAESLADPDEARSRLLRADPLLSMLSISIVEELASALRPVEFDAGDDLIREGEAGNVYLILTAGEADVSQGGARLRRVGPGDGVGEISLLRDVPRTASVTAIERVTAYSLDRGAFLAALTGHSAAGSNAHAIVDHRLRATAAAPSMPDLPPTDARETRRGRDTL
jgi:predicted MFS family arabinose efflux permease